MSKRYVQDSFWTDPYVEKLDPIEKVCFLYLLTNPLCNIAGVYEIRSKRFAFEVGLDVEIVETILQRFERDEKIYRWESWVVIKNFLKNQTPNPSMVIGIENILDIAPDEVKKIYNEKIISLSVKTLNRIKLNKIELNRIAQTVDSLSPPSKKFNAPSLEEVKNYCKERANDVNPQKFMDFYESKGWYVGKNKMKDWKAAVRTWEGTNKNSKNSAGYLDLSKK